MKEWIYGRNAVYETLRAGRRQPFRLWVAQGVQEKGRLAQSLEMAGQRKAQIEKVPRQRLDAISDGHQGIALECSGYPYSELMDILDLAEERAESPFVLILDALQDPQNLGSLFRTAEIAGVHGIILPLRHTVTVTPAVVNASSGASEHLLVAQANLAQSIAALKESGLWVVGLESSPVALSPGQVHLDGPLALVVGSEGQGMRPLVRDSCDVLLRLPMKGNIESLNAAVAGSIALYLAWQARGFV
jgi:23S rRNA (guanosine2251-2'-O)-methyltransferase